MYFDSDSAHYVGFGSDFLCEDRLSPSLFIVKATFGCRGESKNMRVRISPSPRTVGLSGLFGMTGVRSRRNERELLLGSIHPLFLRGYCEEL